MCEKRAMAIKYGKKNAGKKCPENQMREQNARVKKCRDKKMRYRNCAGMREGCAHGGWTPNPETTEKYGGAVLSLNHHPLNEKKTAV
jgi:hypothetical protein